MIRDQLKYSDDFSIAVDESIKQPVVNVISREISVPSDLNNDVDLNGLSAINKYELFKAFGREVTKDYPFSYFIKRPRLYTNRQKT